ncbi:TPA: phosphoribosylamine-glycine ligase [Aquificae Conch Spring virus]|nr:TPA: phosphoribosylamine-glycine ligase [Aquificae Conch Spring virus]
MAVLWLTTGMDCGYIEEFAKHEEVYVFADFISAFPDMEDLAFGRNIPNVYVLTDLPREVLSRIDKVITLECYFGFIIELFKQLNIEVFGAGVEARLENNRLFQKQLMPKVPNYKIVNFDKLSYPAITKVDPVYRNSFESTMIRNQYELEFYKQKLIQTAGQFAKEIEYYQEEILTDIEIEFGIDCICFGNGIEVPFTIGIEQSKNTYIAKIVKNKEEILMKPWAINLRACDFILQQMKYVGFFSTEEIKVKEDPEPYMIDICMRLALPLGTAYLKFYSNVYQAIRNNVPLIPKAEYIYVIPISLPLADQTFVPITFKDEYVFEHFIALQTYYKPKNQKDLTFYAIKNYPTVGCIVLYSNSLVNYEELEKTIEEIEKTIEAPDLKIEYDTLRQNYENFQKMLEILELD